MRWCAIVVRRNLLFFWASSKTKEENVFLDNPLSSRRDEPAFDARIFFRKTELSGGWLGRTLETLEESISGTAQLHTHTDTPIYIRMYIARQTEKRLGGLLHIQLIEPFEKYKHAFL